MIAADRYLNASIAYRGPGLAGKTTNILAIQKSTPAEYRREILVDDGAPNQGPTLRYEFLSPFKLGDARIKLDLACAPGALYHSRASVRILDQANGVVFVADSRPERRLANVGEFELLLSDLRNLDRDIRDIPLLVQVNKRDSECALAAEEVRADLGSIYPELRVFEASAKQCLSESVSLAPLWATAMRVHSDYDSIVAMVTPNGLVSPGQRHRITNFPVDEIPSVILTLYGICCLICFERY